MIDEAGYAVATRMYENLTVEQLEKTAIPVSLYKVSSFSALDLILGLGLIVFRARQINTMLIDGFLRMLFIEIFVINKNPTTFLSFPYGPQTSLKKLIHKPLQRNLNRQSKRSTGK